MTVLSESIDNFKLDITGIGLYYEKYQYKVTVKFQSINRARYYNSVEKFAERLKNKINDIDVEELIRSDGGNIGDLFSFIEWRIVNRANDYKSMICGNYITFYFNDSSNIQSFFDTFDLPWKGFYRQTGINRKKGVVYLKKSKYLWRVFLTNHRLTTEESNTLINLFDNCGVKPCPLLLSTVNKSGVSLYRRGMIFYTHFFDISDDTTLTVVGLQIPHLIRKICSIVRY